MATVQEDVPGLVGKPLFARAHGRSGLGPLQRVDFAHHEIVYCPACQTEGKVYADRRRSRLLK